MGIMDFFKRQKKATGKRDYLAASKGRLYMDFKGSNKSADAEIRCVLRDLRNRARDLERNQSARESRVVPATEPDQTERWSMW